MQRVALITVGIIAVFVTALFLIFMSMRAQDTEIVTGPVAPDGTAFEIPTGPPPGVLRSESLQPRPQQEPEPTDGDVLPTLE